MRHPLRELVSVVAPLAGGSRSPWTSLSAEDLSALASEAYVHGVVPLLWLAVGGQLVDDLDADFVEEEVLRSAREGKDLSVDVFLAATCAAARERNERGLEQLGAVLNVALDLGIQAVPLKGCSLLAGGTWTDPAMRTVYDIDVLVASDGAQELVAALQSEGYHSSHDDATHHLPALAHPEWPLSVEIHLEVLPVGWQSMLPASEVLATARPQSWRYGAVNLTDATTMAAHILAHAYLSDTYWFTGLIPVRALLDVARLDTTASVDWERIDRRFSSLGYGRIARFHRALQDQLVPSRGPAALVPLRSQLDAAWCLAADHDKHWHACRSPLLRWRELVDEGRLTRYYRRQGIEEALWRLRIRKLRDLLAAGRSDEPLTTRVEPAPKSSG